MATVLVVDDEPDSRVTLRRMLEHTGHDVVEAKSGVEALHLLQNAAHPLVVLLDLHLSLLGGAGVLGAVAANKRLVTQHRYILITDRAPTLPRFFATLLARLRVPILRKPFDVDRLVVLIAEAARTLPTR
jgi:CheY-like chemotaxis protein